jgi:2-keto-4-pentenoate hydratase/2-oxohepta-3-ene-1,7-dioic acid hydratase in catechol pathway
MKLCRFLFEKKEFWGRIKQNQIIFLTQAPFCAIKQSSQRIALNKVKLLSPVVPSKVVCAGLNYKEHIKELNLRVPEEPVIFLKPSTTIIGPNESIIYPRTVTQLDYEGELGIVISRLTRGIKESQVSDYILGFTCANDVTARDLQRKDGQWTRAKSFDTFCPVGPWIETRLNPDNLTIKTFLNNKIKQNSSTKNFIFSVPRIVSFISQIMTLLPGDLILTGTPPGIGPMQNNDQIAIEIQGIGRLINKVIN